MAFRMDAGCVGAEPATGLFPPPADGPGARAAEPVGHASSGGVRPASARLD